MWHKSLLGQQAGLRAMKFELLILLFEVAVSVTPTLPCLFAKLLNVMFWKRPFSVSTISSPKSQNSHTVCGGPKSRVLSHTHISKTHHQLSWSSGNYDYHGHTTTSCAYPLHQNGESSFGTNLMPFANSQLISLWLFIIKLHMLLMTFGFRLVDSLLVTSTEVFPFLDWLLCISLSICLLYTSRCV